MQIGHKFLLGLPKDLYRSVDQASNNLGMSKSVFIRQCILDRIYEMQQAAFIKEHSAIKGRPALLAKSAYSYICAIYIKSICYAF